MTPTNWFEWPDEPEQDPEPQVWTLADIYADLGTLNDIAEHLNIKKTRIERWIDRNIHGNVPKPVRMFGAWKIYSKQEWADWFAKFQEGKREGTKWTDNATGYVEERKTKLDPNFKIGNPGLNNPMADWRAVRKRAAAAAADADTD